MLKRKIISQLFEWKNNHSHEALLIKGARQEVKSGNDYEKHTALNNVLDEQSEYVERSLVLNKFQYKQHNDILYLPLYMAMML